VPLRRDIALTYADGALGRRVLARLGEDRVVALGTDDPALSDGSPELKRSLHGVEVVVHLASATAEPLAATRKVLEAAGDAGARHLVVVTSALVYGAWPANPVPLTEEAALRPNPGFEPAVALGEVERLVAEWRDGHPGATVAVLRPAPAVAEDDRGWLAPMLAAARGTPVDDEDPPGQYLHLDDLAAAVAVAVDGRLDGPYNVAPDGWASGEDLRALQGGPRVRLPGEVAAKVLRWRWRAGVSPTPPGLLPWLCHPWVVAADRLRAAGWSPTHSTEEAFVAGHRPAPWAMVSPRRRQELALGGAGVALAGLGAAAAVAWRRLARR
jgi:nucleoside-diphosphate-sugar epimerase